MKLSKKKVFLLMAEREMSYTDLAREAGLSRQNLHCILGRGTSRAKSIGKIANALGVKPEEVLEE